MNEEDPTPPSPASDEIRLHIAEADSDGLGSRMGMEWLVTTPNLVSARIPVEGNTQPFGLLHGGASAVLAESVGSVLANLNAGADRFAVGIELSCSHHRSAHHGFVTAVATPLSIGRSIVSTQIMIRDDEDRLICTARLTCYLRNAASTGK